MPASRFKIPSPPRWAFALVALAAFAFLLRVYVGIWSPEYGITKFLRVGQEFDDRGLAVFRATPKFIDPYPAHRWGFDGQLYAEMSLDPLLRDPQLHVALDDPPYRGQRILLSWIAWVLGLGKPFWVLNAYAALNLIFWVAFAGLAGRLFWQASVSATNAGERRAWAGWGALFGYGATLVTCGVIESMQASLTDLPSFTLILAALVVGGTAGAGILALAALARSTSLIGFVGLAELSPPWGEALRKNIVRGLIAVVPLALWVAYVLWRFRGRQVGFDGGNLDWPLRAIMEKLGEFSVTAVHGPIRWHRWFYEFYKSYDLHALLTIISVLTQSVYLALHRDWRSPLWRWGAVTVVYFACISSLSWESHFTVTRHALPMTLAFNLFLSLRPTKAWAIWFLMGNCFVPFGLRYFDGLREFRTPAPLPEFAIEAPVAGAVPLEARYADGWSPQQWEPESTWRWAAGNSATIIVRNTGAATLRAELRVLLHTLRVRDLRVTLHGASVFNAHLERGHRVIAIGPLALPPGETPLVFTVTGDKAGTDDGTPGDFTFKLENPLLRIAK